jgi:hypothetical protein
LGAELSGIKKLLMGGAVQRTIDAEVAATERLQQLLETPQSAEGRGSDGSREPQVRCA